MFPLEVLQASHAIKTLLAAEVENALAVAGSGHVFVAVLVAGLSADPQLHLLAPDVEFELVSFDIVRLLRLKQVFVELGDRTSVIDDSVSEFQQ